MVGREGRFMGVILWLLGAAAALLAALRLFVFRKPGNKAVLVLGVFHPYWWAGPRVALTPLSLPHTREASTCTPAATPAVAESESCGSQ